MATQHDPQAATIGVADRLRHGLRWTWAFVRYVAASFARHQGPENAASLTYTLLLSLVPLMTVTLAVFSAFPVADKVYGMVQDFVFENFVPTSSEVLQSYLEAFSNKASGLSGAGFAFLVVVALMMMATIDRALNTIWEVHGGRSRLHTFLVYWAVLSLGPLLIGASVLATSYLVSLPLWGEAGGGVGRFLLGVAPVFASMLGFVMLYALVPNRRVPWRHALVGGLAAALLFEAAKRGFAYYVTAFPTYEAIYGALATVPIFLVWVYMSSLIMLLGGEFTRALGMFRYGCDDRGGRGLGLAETVKLLGHLGAAQRRGRALSAAMLGRLDKGWNAQRVEVLLNELRDAGLVHRTDQGRWVPARPLDELTLYDVYRATGFALPMPGGGGWPDDATLAQRLAEADGELRGALSVPLEQFVPEDPAPVSLKRRA